MVAKPMDVNTLIQEINTALKDAFSDYRGVYFFGSRWRKDNQEYSDYDMVFVFRTPPDWRKKDQVREIVYRTAIEYDVVIDGKYYAQKEVEEYQTPFLEAVYKQGAFYAV
jgi:predicted nucleotidyltransferase